MSFAVVMGAILGAVVCLVAATIDDVLCLLKMGLMKRRRK